MKKVNLFKKMAGTILITGVIYTMLFCNLAFAKGTVTVKADKEKINNGEEFSVTVEANNDGDSSVAPEVSITYDTNRLLFNDCSVEYGGGSGGLVTIKDTKADISFTSLSGGTAEVDVSVTFDGDGTNTAAASAYVEVEGEDTAKDIDNNNSASGIETGFIKTEDDSIVISTVFEEDVMPVGFHKESISYEEQMVESAKSDMGDATLLYVVDAEGSNGRFVIYNEQTKTFSDFLQIMGIENRFIIVLKADENVVVPSNVIKANLEWASQNCEAYAFSEEVVSTENVPMNDFFLVYAMSSEGNKGFYMYDKVDGTYQRYVGLFNASSNTGASGLPGIGNSNSENSDEQSFIMPVNNSSNISKGSKLLSYQIMGYDAKIVVIAALGIIVIILLIILTITAVGRNRDDYYYEEDEPDSSYNSYEKNNLNKIDSNKETETVSRDVYESEKDTDIIDIEDIADEEVKEEKEVKLANKDAKDDEEVTDSDVDISEETQDIFEEEKTVLSRKEQKAYDKAKKKEAKRLKKEYGEHGPVDWAEFESIVKGDDDRRPTSKSYDDLPDYMKEDLGKDTNNEVSEKEETSNSDNIREDSNANSDYEFPTKPKEIPMEMMKKIPANDNNARVQPKPVQQVELDEDFEFEFLKFDDDD